MSEARKRGKLVHIRVTADEKRMLENNAKRYGYQRVVPYLLSVSKGTALRKGDDRVRQQHTNTLNYITLYTNYLMHMINSANEYQPEEMCEIHRLVKDIYKMENELIEIVGDICYRN